MSSAVQKKAIKDFRAVTGSTEKVAIEHLSSVSYDLDRAVDLFYSKSAKSSSAASAASKAGDRTKLSKLFDKYAGTGDEKDLMADARLGSFFTDAAINPESAITLGLAWQLKCKNFGEIERKEFIEGLSSLSIDSIDGIKKDAKRIENLLSDKKSFREFYRWLFDFIKDSNERKTIETESAYEMWNLVLPQHFPRIKEFIEFCRGKSLKSIPKDLWEQLYEFSKEIKSDFSNYEEDSAWPVIIDQFVEVCKKK